MGLEAQIQPNSLSRGEEDERRGLCEDLAQESLQGGKGLDKTYWVHTHVLYVNKLGKVRVVICYDNEDMKGEPVYLATNRLYWEEVRVVQCYSLRLRRRLL